MHEHHIHTGHDSQKNTSAPKPECHCRKDCLKCTAEELTVSCGCDFEAKQQEYPVHKHAEHNKHEGHNMKATSHHDHEAAMTDLDSESDGSGHSSAKLERNFVVALILNGGLAIGEVTAGIVLNSSALLADGFMNVDDTAALILSIYSERKTRQAPDERRTFGYKRMDAFAGFMKGCLLLVTALMAFLQAMKLLIDPEPIMGIPVMIIGGIAIVVILVSALGLKADACCSLNAKGTYECLKYDVVGSAAVVVSGFLSYFYGFVYFDVAAALLITVFMVKTGWGIFREGMEYFLQSAPKGFDYGAFEKAVLGVSGVTSVGDIHVWSQNPSEHHLTCKVTVKIEDVCDCEKIIGKVEAICSEFGIRHATIQPVYSEQTLQRFCKAKK